MIARAQLVLVVAFLFAPCVHGQPKQDKSASPVLLDSLGDPLPDGASARLGTLRFKHTPSRNVIVDAAAYSPDGAKIASLASSAGSIRLWEAGTGKELRGPWSASALRFTAVAFSPDGTLLAAAVNPGFRPGNSKDKSVRDTVILFDITRAAQGSTLAGPAQSVHAIAFADGGKTLVAAGDGAVRWWHVSTGKEQRSWQPFVDEPAKTSGNVSSFKTFSQCALSPDAQAIALQVEWRNNNQNGRISPRFVNDGATAETMGFQLATGKKYWHSFGARGMNERSHFAFSADGTRLAIAMGSEKIEVRDAVTGKLVMDPLDTKSLGSGQLGGLALSADARTMALASGDSNVHIVSTEQPSDARKFTARIAHNRPGSTACLSFTPGDTGLLVGVDSELQFYDVQTLGEVRGTEGHRGWIEQLAFTPDGKRLMTGLSGRGQSSGEYFGPNGEVYYLVTGTSGAVPTVEQAAWDVAAWKRVQLTSLRTPPWPNFGSASLDQSVYVGKEGDDRFALYDLKSGRLLARMLLANKQLTPGAAPTFRLAGDGRVTNAASATVGFFSPAGKHYVLYAGENQGEVTEYVYAVPSGKLVCLMPPVVQNRNRPLTLSSTPSDPSDNLAFSPDERLVAQFGRGDGLIHVYDTATGKLRHVLGSKVEIEGRQPQFFAQHEVAFSADNKFLVSWSSLERFLRMWDMGAGTELVQIAQDDTRADVAATPGGQRRLKLAWSPDGRMLAVGEGTIRVWEIATLRLRRELAGHQEGSVRALAFAPGSQLLASASTDTTVLIWDTARSARSEAAESALDGATLEKRWQALAADDAAGAYAAILDLAAAPKESVPWIKDRVTPDRPIDPKLIDSLIRDLNDNQFKARQSATTELLQIGARAVPAIDKALAAKPSLETRLRLQNIRKGVTGPVLKGVQLRAYRTVEVLEKIATPEARDLLRSLASGAPGGKLTTQALDALARLER